MGQQPRAVQRLRTQHKSRTCHSLYLLLVDVVTHRTSKGLFYALETTAQAICASCAQFRVQSSALRKYSAALPTFACGLPFTVPTCGIVQSSSVRNDARPQIISCRAVNRTVHFPDTHLEVLFLSDTRVPDSLTLTFI